MAKPAVDIPNPYRSVLDNMFGRAAFTTTQLRLPTGMLDKLTALAASDNRSRSSLMRHVLVRYILAIERRDGLIDVTSK